MKPYLKTIILVLLLAAEIVFIVYTNELYHQNFLQMLQ